MKPFDYLKAAGIALLVLVADVALRAAAVAVYPMLDPGRDPGFYAIASLDIALWTTRIVAPLLFIVAGFVFCRRRPERNGYAFVLTIFVFYAVFNAVWLLANGFPPRGFLLPDVLLTNGLKLAGVLIGAVLAQVGRDAGDS